MHGFVCNVCNNSVGLYGGRVYCHHCKKWMTINDCHTKQMPDVKLFETIADNEESGTCKCLLCGCQFDWDVHEEINLFFIQELGYLVRQCPGCNAKGQ